MRCDYGNAVGVVKSKMGVQEDEKLRDGIVER